MTPSENDSFVRAFSRGLDVVQELGAGPSKRTMASIAEAVGISRSAVRRLLITLTERGFVSTDGKTFSLTPRMLNFGLSYLQTLPFWPYSQPALEALRAATEESCGMAVLDGSDIVYVLRIPSRRILAMNANIGTRLPAHYVSLGQVLLSGLDPAGLKSYGDSVLFERRTAQSITSMSLLETTLEKVREKGYAWVDGELDSAICGLAVPLRKRNGQIIAAINISLISGAWSEAQAIASLLTPLREAAEQIRAAMPAQL